MPSCWNGDTSDQQSEAGPRLKIFVIFLLCTMAISFTVILDCPRVIKNDLIAELKISQNQYDLQYHLIFCPNIFCWLAGFIVDRYLELRITAVLFITIAMFGNTLYAIGGVTQVYEVMLTGRLITGLGVEASYIYISCYVLRWFPKKLTNTVFALTKSLSLIGNTFVFGISDMLMQRMSRTMMKKHALAITIATVMSIIVVPLASAIILALISKPQRTRGNIPLEQQTIKFMDILKFPVRFWFLSSTANLFFSSCLTFLQVNVLSTKYGLNELQTEVLVRSFSIGACVMAPILGFIVDWKGRNLTFITLSTLGGLIAHFSLAFLITDPFYPMILLSFSYSMMVGSYWSLYRFLFKSYQSTALGIDHAILMFFCALGNILAPLFINFITYAVEIFYLVFNFIAVIGCCILWGLECSVGSLNNNKPKNKTEVRSRKRANGRQRRRQRQEMGLKERKVVSEPQTRALRPQIRGYEITYLRLKRIEAEKTMFKHQRMKRRRNRLTEKRRTKSSEELNEIK